MHPRLHVAKSTAGFVQQRLQDPKLCGQRAKRPNDALFTDQDNSFGQLTKQVRQVKDATRQVATAK
jgi:hypothetical protein